MKFITVRDFSVNNKKTREIISNEEAVITYNGKPIGIVLPAGEEDIGFMLREASAVLAKKAAANMRKESAKGLAPADIEGEIKAVRKKHKR